MYSQLKSYAGDYLQMRAIRRHGSRVGWRDAGRYTEYWERARRECPRPMPEDPVIRAAIVEFSKSRLMSFHTDEAELLARSIARKLDAREAAGEKLWFDRAPGNSTANYIGNLWFDFPEVKALLQGPLGKFLEGYFGSAYKIFFGIMYLAVHDPSGPANSALWHSDSGPGSCVNVMFHLDDTVPEDGVIEILPWETSLRIFRRERPEIRRRLAQQDGKGADAANRRTILCNWYKEVIEEECSREIVQPIGRAGLVAAFANNTIHRGGFPEPGHRRRVVLFHAYPSHRPTNWSKYDSQGIMKTSSYPPDPAADF